MTIPRSITTVTLGLAVLVMAHPGSARAQAQAQVPVQTPQPPASEYEPQEGQDGKDVVWVPTPEALVQRMLDIGKVTAADYLMDLGSGDGRTVIAAAQRGARAHGIEYNPEMVALAKRRALAAGMTGKATFEEADLFQTDFSKATVITMFLLPSINLELRPKLLELKPGTRIVSNTFTMEAWEPDEQSKVEDDCMSWCTALLWIVPAKVAGTWTLGSDTLTLTQEFQKVSGTLGAATIADGRLLGDRLTFTAGGRTYEGRVDGSRIAGTVGGAAFTATRQAP